MDSERGKMSWGQAVDFDSTSSKGAGIFSSRGSTPQMSLAYSRMVRSEENFQEPAILAKTMRAHRISSYGKNKPSFNKTYLYAISGLLNPKI